MADEKLTALAETTDLDDDSLLYVVKDPATVPISRKITFLNMVNEMGLGSYTPQNGWVPVSDTWTPASTTDPYTVTVPAGAEVIYNKGDKVRLKQGGAYKYFYIYGTTDALLDITGGSDYALTTDAITDVYYSKVENPLDFPDWFNWTVTHTGFSANPTYVAKFFVRGKTCFINYFCTGDGTSNATTYYVTIPITAANFQVDAPCAYVKDSGSAAATGLVIISANGTYAELRKSAAATWTNSGGKSAVFQMFYGI